MFTPWIIIIFIPIASGFLDTTSDQYVGCYKDSHSRAMQYDSWQQTIEACVSRCKVKNAHYAGMQAAGHCFCGENYAKYGSSMTGCNRACPGRMSTICGGSWSNICPSGCRDWCSAGEESICDECVLGKYGNKCRDTCPENCNVYTGCYQNTGECLGCSDGYWGEFCNDACSATCATSQCNQSTGHCDLCVSGYHGAACESECGHCMDRSCYQENGQCIMGCEDGYWGEFCESECGNCMNHSCYQENGQCILGCEDGYYLPQCNASCPQNCDTRCEQENGTCTDGCNEGYYDAICSAKCPGNCNSQNCEQTNGYCIDGCGSGYHGAWCSNTCDGCEENSCDRSGYCTKGCKPGFSGSSCTEFCPNGNFGLLCNMSCFCADGVSCDPVGGKCPSGCAEGWMGKQCAQPVMQEEKSFLGAIIGGAIAIIIITVLIIIGIVIFRRKFNLKDKEPSQIALEDQNHVETTGVDHKEMDLDEVSVTEDIPSETVKDMPAADIYENPVALNTECAVDHLTDYIKETDLDKEYKLLLQGIVHPWTVAQKNKAKNRYKGIMAYDHSRVILQTSNNSESDFINANYMPGYQRDKFYIASQGPTVQIVNDFWRMVWQTGAKVIVMTTNLEENQKMKCEQYWPNEGSIHYGAVTVSKQEEIMKHHHINRVFLVKQGDESRVVHQFHLTDWPDHGLPDRTNSILHFRQVIRKHSEGHDTPIVVHCSAGVGRSGTFIALDYLLEEAADKGRVDVVRCVNALRNNRVQIVQNGDQYKFLYHALNDGVTVGCTFVTQTDVGTITNEKIENQFKFLQKLKRGMQIPSLPLNVTSKSDKTYITTLIPAANGITKFWEIVVEKGSLAVVFCVDELKKKNTWLPMLKAPMVLTSGVKLSHKTGSKVGEHYVDIAVTQGEQAYDNIGYEEQTYMNVQQPGSDNLIRAFTVQDSMPLEKYITICSALQKMAEKPVIVAYNSSVSQCGLLIGSCMVLEEFLVYGEVDIFDTVRRLQQLHPGFLDTVDQYQQLYAAIEPRDYEEVLEHD